MHSQDLECGRAHQKGYVIWAIFENTVLCLQKIFVYWKFRRRITAIVYGGNSRRHHNTHLKLAPGSHPSFIISQAMRTI